jgi:small subunit ribosomal protein S3Ae
MPTEQEKLVKRKKWYTILASKEFNNVEIGELPASEADFLVGRNLPVSLSNVTNDIKKQNIRITFKITGVQDNKAITEAVAYELSPMQVKRLIRPDKSKIDDSFLCETKHKGQIQNIFLSKE